jgi:hypothetical protein
MERSARRMLQSVRAGEVAGTVRLAADGLIRTELFPLVLREVLLTSHEQVSGAGNLAKRAE